MGSALSMLPGAPQQTPEDPSLAQAFMGQPQGGMVQVPGAQGPVNIPGPLAQLMQQYMGGGGQPAPGAPPGMPIPKRKDQYDVTPETTGLANADRALRGAQANLGMAKSVQAQGADAMMDQGIADQEKQYQANADARNKRLADIQKESDTLKAQVQSYGATETDPYRIFKRAGTGAQLAMGIQMAMTGFITGSPTAPMQLMNNIIEHDLQGQAEDRRRQGEVLGLRERLNSRDEARAEDQFKSDELRRATQWDFVKRRADVERNRSTDPIVKANAQVLAAQAEQESSKAILEAAEKNVNLRAGNMRAAIPLAVQKETERFYPTKAAIDENAKLNEEVTKGAMDIAKGKASGPLGAPKGTIPIRNPYTGEPLGNVPTQLGKTVENFVRESRSLYDDLNTLKEYNQKAQTWWQQHPDLPLVRNPWIQAQTSLYADTINRARASDNLGVRFNPFLKELEDQEIGGGPETWLRPDPIVKLEQSLAQVRERADGFSQMYFEGHNWLDDSGGRTIKGAPFLEEKKGNTGPSDEELGIKFDK